MRRCGRSRGIDEKFRPLARGSDEEQQAREELYNDYSYSTVHVFDFWLESLAGDVKKALRLAKASCTPEYEALKKELGVKWAER